jgi:hypothetical protein
MRLETVRIDLGDGDYALAFREVIRRTARLHEAELRKYMTMVETPESKAKMLLTDAEKMETIPKAEFIIDREAVIAHDDDINELYILNQVTEWSFGPVDHDTLDTKVTKRQYKTLVTEMDRLYSQVPLPAGATREKP